MRSIRSVALIAVLALALAAPGPATAKSKPAQPKSVLAIVDTGINPYHITFRDDSPQAYKHPSTYIQGYPKDAVAFKLSFNEPDYWSAVKKDCKRWNEVETGKLYWFPGTKIIGGITFSPQASLNCSADQPFGGGRIIDDGGHGTMTASRATSTEYGACKECHVVAVQFSANGLNSEDALNSISWAGENADWIDAQSNSWGPLVPAWEPTGQGQLITSNPALVREVEEVSRQHLAFWASGNGALFRFGVLGHPTTAAPHFTPSAIIVGGHDSGYMTTWTGFPPHVVSDACNSWAAYSTELEKSDGTVGGGTSGATPFVAGGATKILLEARRILGDSETGVSKGVVARGPKGLVKSGPLADGEFTMEEWKRVVFVTATPRPKAQHEDGPTCGVVDGNLYMASPIKWEDVPDGYPEFLHIGYGAVDDPAIALAFDVLRGKADEPDRSTTDQYFAVDRAAREAGYEVWSKP